ncbi:MAG: DUF302 domain-containing protein [Candidatus Gracilibacteria bacterium]|nr:DUF302 domain-containing protein [Candidatus Gracilibacteria bacterium]
MDKFGYTRELHTGFLEALDDVKFSLQEQGFGVINTIDVQDRIKKTGKEIQEYVVIGACNPYFASEALDEEYEIGLFFPCNVILYKKENKVYVSVIKPTHTMGFLNNEGLNQLAQKLEKQLITAIDNI